MASVAAESPIDPLAASPRRDARSPEVKALTALLCGAAACLLSGVAFPMSDQAPRGLGVAMIGVALALAALTFFAGPRLPRRALLAVACLVVVLNSYLVTRAHTTGGAIADAFAYIWLTVYVAAFFPALWAPFGVLVAAGFGAGLLLSGLPGLFTAWMLLSLSVLTAGAVVSQVSRVLVGRASTDALTGALNRSGLQEAARRLMLRRRRHDDRRVAVVAVDLDGFKAVNDHGGHASGDRLLAEATAAWRGALRDGDVLARTGGDEFIILMPDTEPAEAGVVLARLRAAHPVAWSAGVTGWRDGEPLAACLERADRELYAVKHAR
jgi:diguanylate cyclase (GGDEF)-like protein